MNDIGVPIWQLIALLLIATLFIVGRITGFRMVKRLLVGRPLKTRELGQAQQHLVWYLALPILSADLYSSVAYGPEAGATELVGLGRGAEWLILPIVGATVLLLLIIVLSYIMGILAYPNGGGGYSIARDNFRPAWISLVAASALMIDYVLTVAVSVSAGILAIASAYPGLVPYETVLSVICVALIALVNLRGVSESATLFSWPNFLFAACMLFLIGWGVTNDVSHGFVQPQTPPFGVLPKGFTLLLILKAFSSACSSLTGIETISNAVPIFREPKQMGAIKAYVTMTIVTGITLVGIGYQLYVKGITVKPNNTMLSQLTAVYFGHGPIYQIITWSTFLVLIIAANSTFTGFPQLMALVARDKFLPEALSLRGDRLGFSNGLMVLALLSSVLLVVFQAQTNALIPLFAIGVFMSFTIAQIGMMKRWMKLRTKRWQGKAFVNAVGAVVTALVTLVFSATKFSQGAWIVLFAIPLMVSLALMIRRHYARLERELALDVQTELAEEHHVISVLLLSDIDRIALQSVSFAKSIAQDLIAVYIGFDDESIAAVEAKWKAWGEPCRLLAFKNEYRSVLQPLTRLVKRLQTREGREPDHIHILLPQLVPRVWWQFGLHNQRNFVIQAWFLRNQDVVVSTIPYHTRDR
ncbi:APC family permease [Ferroacidibacillus organovorans]|nr:APC family permease [Ferroacidibacillus organovorans]